MAKMSTFYIAQSTRNAVLYGGDLSANQMDAQILGWRDLVMPG